MKKYLSVFFSVLLLAAVLLGCAGQGAGKTGSQAPESAAPEALLVPESTPEPTLSPAGETLKTTPPDYMRLLQIGHANLNIKAAVKTPAGTELARYQAEYKVMDTTAVTTSLGGQAQGIEQALGEEYYPDYTEQFTLLVNSGTFFQLELCDKNNSYVATEQNRADSATPEKCAVTAEQAAKEAQETVELMGLELTADEPEAYNPCPQQIAALSDTRPPTDTGFFIVNTWHTLEGAPLRYAAQNVAQFKAWDEDKLYSYADPHAYTGLRFTVGDRGIRAVQGVSFAFKKLGAVTEILSLDEAVEQLIYNSYVTESILAPNSFGKPPKSFSIDSISLEYVYEKYYPLQKVRDGLNLSPMWCFSARPQEGGGEIMLFVNAIDGRISYYKQESPTEMYPLR